jgi:hypothetical protein
VRLAVEDWRARVAPVSIKIRYKEGSRTIVPNFGSASNLRRQSDRMPNDVQIFVVFYLPPSAYSYDPMIGYRPINPHQRPICTVTNLLSPDDVHASINFRVVDDGSCSRCVLHAEAENEPHGPYVARIHTMASRRNDIGGHKKTRAEACRRLVSERLRGAQVERRAKVLRLQGRCPISVVKDLSLGTQYDHTVRVVPDLVVSDLENVFPVVNAVDDLLFALQLLYNRRELNVLKTRIRR